VRAASIDPAALMPYADFAARADRLVDRLHATRRPSSDQGILVPGERGVALAAERERNGDPVPAPLLRTLQELASDLGVPAP
jgi:LDH2 family malate/lactate/ureidoglycolate dehydrogenase